MGEESTFQHATAANPVDVTSGAPLVLGPSLVGGLDGIRIYDFNRSPLVVYANGQTVIKVVADANGKAQVPISSTAFFSGPAGYERTGASRDLQQSIAIGGSYGDYIWQRNRDTLRRFNLWTERHFTTGCPEALKTGEPATLLGFGCEVGVGLWTPTAVGQGVRDGIYAVRNFSRSKKQRRDYFVAVLALGFAAVAVVPTVRALKPLVKAKAAVEVSENATKVLAHEVEEQLVKEVPDFVPEHSMLSLFADEADPVTKKAALELIDSTANPQAAREAIDRIATRWGADGPAALVTSLNNIRKNGRLANASLVIERLTHAIDKMPEVGKLGDDVLEGMGLFLDKTNADGNLVQIWKTLQANATEGRAVPALQQLFSQVREANAANVPDLINILNQMKGGGLTGLKGAFNHLEGVIEYGRKNGFARIVSLDKARQLYHGRPDLLADSAGGLLEIEFKNLGKGATKLTGANDRQLQGKIQKAIERATNSAEGLTRKSLGDELSRIQYKIRGSKTDYPDFAVNFEKNVAAWLDASGAGEFQDLAERVGLEFQNKGLPF